MIFACYDLLNDIIALYFSTLVFYYYLFRVNDIVLSWDNLIFYSKKNSIMFSLSGCEPLSF